MGRIRLGVLGLFFVVLFAVLFLMSMGKRLDHDEHQFVASGALLARRGLWPYRDYAYFHMPNLIIVNAILFRISDHLLLVSRLMSTVAAFCTSGLIFFTVRSAFSYKPRARTVAAAIATLMLVCNPVFLCASGRAWNHDLPTLFALGAFLCAVRGLRQKKSAILVTLSGALLCLAIGTRLTFAPAALSLVAIIAISPAKSWREKAILILILTASATIALLPSWLLLVQAPGEFLFGNFSYPALNTQFHIDSAYPRSMTLAGKFGFVFSNLLAMPGNLLLSFCLSCRHFESCAELIIHLTRINLRRSVS